MFDMDDVMDDRDPKESVTGAYFSGRPGFHLGTSMPSSSYRRGRPLRLLAFSGLAPSLAVLLQPWLPAVAEASPATLGPGSHMDGGASA